MVERNQLSAALGGVEFASVDVQQAVDTARLNGSALLTSYAHGHIEVITNLMYDGAEFCLGVTVFDTVHTPQDPAYTPQFGVSLETSAYRRRSVLTDQEDAPTIVPLRDDPEALISARLTLA